MLALEVDIQKLKGLLPGDLRPFFVPEIEGVSCPGQDQELAGLTPRLEFLVQLF